MCFCAKIYMYPMSFTPLSVRTISPKTFRLASKSNYDSLHIFILVNHFFVGNLQWSLVIDPHFIHNIHHYIISKSFVNVDFILVPNYMIHDIIIEISTFSTILGTWGSSRTELLITSNESFEIFTFLIRSSCILAPFLIQEFLSLKPIGLPCFKHVFGTNRPTTLQACYELISNIFGALAIGINYLFSIRKT